MKKLYIVLLSVTATCTALTFSSCKSGCKQGSGKRVTQTRKVEPFSQLNISGDYEVTIKQDTANSLSITADDNLMDDIKSDVSGDKLTVKSSGSFCNAGKSVLNIHLKDLSSVTAAGAVTIASDGKLSVKDLEIGLSGTTKVTLDMTAGNVITSSSGLTDISLTGQASSHTVQMSGSGQLNALDFVVAKYRIETSGQSDCKINVLNQLDVSSSGASQIEYRGNPATIHNDKSGASTIKKVE